MSKKQVPVVLKVENTIQLLNNWGNQGQECSVEPIFKKAVPQAS